MAIKRKAIAGKRKIYSVYAMVDGFTGSIV